MRARVRSQAASRLAAAAATALAIGLGLAACGGGDSGVAPTGLQDTTPYSTAAGGSLANPIESSAVTGHSIVVGGATVAYTATAGHLTALDPATHAAEVSMFYVAYTVAPPAGAQRPLVFFYNGGPGSASVWLHLGSFAPRRIVTDDPSLAVPQPFQLVDNAESLIDVADLVFVDAVGSGYSTAVAPHLNRDFWSVDLDAAVMRDFIARYVEVNGRGASPVFLYGESYGTTRSAVLARKMIAAGMRLDGVVLNSSVLDYNANCGLFPAGSVSCEGAFPSYGMIGAWFQRTQPVPGDTVAYAQQLRDFATASYGPVAAAWVQSRTPAAPALLDQLVALTGAPLALWAADVDLHPTSFRQGLLPGQLLGVYDARMAAMNGSALANSGDPSSAAITPAFSAAARSLFVDELQYVPSAPYTLLSSANTSWNYAHDGRALPDTVPDLGTALAANPALRVLSIAGYHDLSTPFHQTELDIDRLGAQPAITHRVYAGGHMTYLDDGSRPRIKAAVAAFIAGSAPIPAEATRIEATSTRGPVAMAASPASGDKAASAATAPTVVPGASAPPPGPPEAVDHSALAEGGGPWLPLALRTPPTSTSPRGAALRALIARKLAEDRGAIGR